MKKWVIPVVWQESGEMVVEATTLEAAMAKAVNSPQLPSGSYVCDSMELSCPEPGYIREFYNNGQMDE